MKLADVSIQRPVFTLMMVLALVVLGLFSYSRLGVDQYPNIDFPYVIINTTLKGAGVEEMETSVTKLIEEAVNTISGIEDLTAYSFEGLSQVIVSFDIDKDPDVAAQEVRDNVNRILRDFPEGTDPPVIQKLDPGATPVMSIAVRGALPLREITNLAKKKIKEPLETTKGVGRISLVGGREREIHVVIDPLKMAAYRLTVQQIKDALRQQNVELPGGRVDQQRRELVLRTLGRIEKPEDFQKIIIANVNGVPIRVRDVGRVEDTEEEPRSLARLDGQTAVSLTVQKQSGTNTVEVIRLVKAKLEELRPGLPSGVTAEVVRDQSDFIVASVHSVQEHLILGAILASLMVLLFMGDLRSTLIASLSIPTSLIATFILMDIAGFTLDTMTLLGLALAVGVVIDDAIVVLENIFRHMEEDKIPARKAASTGTREIGLAVMATTLSLVIIFLPLAYMQGIVGRFLKSYGLTVAFAIMVSLFVAFSLTPMLSSRFLRLHHGPRSRFQMWVDRLNEFLKSHYGRLVRWSLAHRAWVVAFAALTVLSTIPLIRMVGKDFLPPDDRSEFDVNIQAPEGTTLAITDGILGQIEQELRRLPGVTSLLTTIGEGDGKGVNDGKIFVRLRPQHERKHDQFQIMAMARRALAKYAGLRTSVTQVNEIGASVAAVADFAYVISGPDLGTLQRYAGKIIEELRAVPGFVDLDTSFAYAKPELQVRIDRDRAQDLGVKVEDIATSLRTMVGGEEDITKYKEGDELYPVRTRVDREFRDRPETVSALYVPSSKIGLVRLDNVASLEERKGPSQIDRLNRQRQVTITANLDGLGLGDAIARADRIAKSVVVDPGYQTSLIGKGKEFGRMITGFLIAFGLSLIFMYMILASQFESLLHPVTILLSLPLSIPFAILSLLLLGQHLTIFSIMGLFMLFGIVKKNAILQVDYTNTLRQKGMARDPAIVLANETRLRPILMTTLVLVAAMLPVAFGTGPGAASRATMAVVIVGGQSLCLLITLLITPVSYSIFDDIGQKLRGFRGHRESADSEAAPAR